MNARRTVATATKLGVSAGVVGVAAAAFPTGGASAGVDDAERCIDVIGDTGNDGSDDWDLDAWSAFLGTCEADFGEGKLVVDVVTEGGEPLPAGVDLDAIVDAFDFGYADPTRDAQKARFDPFCNLQWEGSRRDQLEVEVNGFGWTDFRMDEDVAGRRVRVLQLLGDRDDPTGPGADEFGLAPNRLVFSWFCNGDTDQLRMTAVADVGGGYQLEAGVNPSFTGFTINNDTGAFFDVTEIEVVVSQVPATTTTTTTTTTTVAPTTVAPTTAAPTTVAPTQPPLSPTLPETGRSSTGSFAAIAALLLGLGLGAARLARRHPADG